MATDPPRRAPHMKYRWAAAQSCCRGIQMHKERAVVPQVPDARCLISVLQAGLRNIEEEAAPELHRAISGDLMTDDDVERGTDENNEEVIFRVKEFWLFDIFVPVRGPRSWLYPCVTSQRHGSLFGNPADPFFEGENRATSQRPLRMAEGHPNHGL